MVTTKIMDEKRYPKPIVMPKNPARCHMPYALARADDLAAIERQKQLEKYENELKAETKKQLEEKAKELVSKEQEKVPVSPKAEEKPEFAETSKVESKGSVGKAKNPFKK